MKTLCRSWIPSRKIPNSYFIICTESKRLQRVSRFLFFGFSTNQVFSFGWAELGVNKHSINIESPWWICTKFGSTIWSAWRTLPSRHKSYGKQVQREELQTYAWWSLLAPDSWRSERELEPKIKTQLL